MPARHQRVTAPSDDLAAALEAIRDELSLDAAFPPAAIAEAEAFAADPRLPDADRTGIPFITIDPEGSTDLDQALHLERDGDGFLVHYAIADVAAFALPGGAIDLEARRRGQTMYAPDGRVPLHPAVVSEGAASLHAGEVRGAYVWSFRLDASGRALRVGLERARVRSRAQRSYAEAQRLLDGGDAMLGLLREVGELRIALEAERGGASLDMPEEEIERDGDEYRLTRRELLPVERWNAQLSLMTGMEAATLMLGAGAGILRTMPPPPERDVRAFRAEVAAIGEPWREDEHYGDFLRRLDRSEPSTLAILQAARRLFRGAAYRVITEGADASDWVQAAIGAPYAHATAPLRRLVDRYVLAHCEAIANGREVPPWAAEGLEGLPEIMQESSRIAGTLERASVDAVEIAVLRHRVGEEFDAVVVESRKEGATIQLIDPPTEAMCDTAASPGERIRARLVEADLAERSLRFADAALTG
ncbi:RNB domain-containing ribonuclease [Agrococcus sp. Marseille-Q4369]|uniref:RNB domain-containing ribonuclease n=1 Tax=Agrococcus sp. Marseille-Q4369 TaxID=2810513 RepID=UPI001B8D4715|nr:RNB domain-containing ribonuclease [Agrococcus sp. Marseille-Q4369]QUW19596.1 RNB domain-containing ribonuclease [Agrococcus sp. Marseille-Q4369]